MATFLLELFSEEIPARMQRPAAEAMKTAFTKALADARLEHSGIRGYVSPRHLAISVTGLPAQQPDISVEKKGPKTSAPQPAIDGFLKSSGLSLDALEKRMVGKDETYFAIIHQKGQPTADALKPIAEKILAEFTWPKSMRWGAYDIRWVRPLHSILCLLDDKVVPVSFGHIKADRITHGHRFLAPAAISLKKADDYEAALEAAKVIVCPERRKAMIQSQAHEAAASKKLELKSDEGLLTEVTGLVEWPTVLVGKIDDAYMDLPPEVLISEMRAHQKYFALQDAKGTFAPHFLITSNMVTTDGGKQVIAGNERVLRARLSDGRFFWDQDRKVSLADWGKKLAGVTFHAKIGTIGEKAERIQKLAVFIAGKIGADVKQAERAATLCKADLVTGMVGEFPELQGVMGRYYALAQKEDAAVADAIRDHYLPMGPDSPVPTEKTAICVALADKIDTLTGMFAIGEKPTGSKDPFALRRAGLGIIRIILENNLRVSLDNLLVAGSYFGSDGKITKAQSTWNVVGTNKEIIPEIRTFFLDRLKVMLRDQGMRHDIISAAFDGSEDDDLVRLVERAKALQDFIVNGDGANLLAGSERARNIVRIEAKKDGTEPEAYLKQPVDAKLLKEKPEQELHAQLGNAKPVIEDHLKNERYTQAMAELARLRPYVDAFFEKVLVNDADKAIRENRLRLLASIDAVLGGIANFSLIESPSAAKKAA